MVVAGERRDDVGVVSGSLGMVTYQRMSPMAVWRRRVILFFWETAWAARRGEKRHGLPASLSCLVCSVKSDIGQVVTTALTSANTE
jgi:hypothetical protein